MWQNVNQDRHLSQDMWELFVYKTTHYMTEVTITNHLSFQLIHNIISTKWNSRHGGIEDVHNNLSWDYLADITYM